MSDVYVRLEAGRGVISISEPFFENDEQRNVYNEAFRHYSGLFNVLFPAEIYGSLSKLGDPKLTGETGE
jgi:hypothetical protein